MHSPNTNARTSNSAKTGRRVSNRKPAIKATEQPNRRTSTDKGTQPNSYRAEANNGCKEKHRAEMTTSDRPTKYEFIDAE